MKNKMNSQATLYFITALVLFPSLLFSQSRIIGKIVDKTNREPIESALVREEGNSGNVTVSNKNGEFIL